jgi:hypothetical protein
MWAAQTWVSPGADVGQSRRRRGVSPGADVGGLIGAACLIRLTLCDLAEGPLHGLAIALARSLHCVQLPLRLLRPNRSCAATGTVRTQSTH